MNHSTVRCIVVEFSSVVFPSKNVSIFLFWDIFLLAPIFPLSFFHFLVTRFLQFPLFLFLSFRNPFLTSIVTSFLINYPNHPNCHCFIVSSGASTLSFSLDIWFLILSNLLLPFILGHLICYSLYLFVTYLLSMIHIYM